MKFSRTNTAAALGAVLLACAFQAQAQYQMERLSRGVVAVRTSSSQVYVGWRLFGNEGSGTSFNLYRSSNGGSPTLLNGTPLTSSTNFVDTSAPPTQSNVYTVRAVVNGVEQSASAAFTLPANAPTRQYLEIPLQIPGRWHHAFGRGLHLHGERSFGRRPGRRRRARIRAQVGSDQRQGQFAERATRATCSSMPMN